MQRGIPASAAIAAALISRRGPAFPQSIDFINSSLRELIDT
ncbi:MAG: hypothetical protein KatS3mg011_1771 [Acidimicrobiia bacterium]|nr:MAG: hypothetical protein KatS3mg011_1771 [Acidimicrobiia bacterium]